MMAIFMDSFRLPISVRGCGQCCTRLYQMIVCQLLITSILCLSVPGQPSIETQCSTDHRYNEEGQISSPNFPDFYPNDINCKWHIYHESNEIITISFTSFDIEGQDGAGCTADVLTITDKHSQAYCGSSLPTPYISSLSENKRLRISFESDSSNTRKGFQLTYFKGVFPAESCDAETQFFCQNKKCIPRKWLCNGQDECGDRSDESVMVCPQEPSQSPATGSTTVPHCPSHTMYCLDRTHHPLCLPEDKKCDGSQDCLSGKDEHDCETVCDHQLINDIGFFTSPNFPDSYPNDLECRWTIVVSEGNIVQLRFVRFDLEQGYHTDYVSVYDGSSDNADLIGTYYGYKSSTDSTSTHYPPSVIEGTRNRLHVVFITDGSAPNTGFNATYQTKGHCIGEQRLCAEDDLNCYAPDQHCDGILTCLRGEDEMGCSNCPADKIPCNPHDQVIKCYSKHDRCNGQSQCSENYDEMNCSATLCNSHVGLFLCRRGRCIHESWICDTNVDCEDGSDEQGCPMSTKVITAAVVGSIVCGLLLVAALSCTCKLYQLYHSDPHPPTHTSPLREIEDELMRREAPPSYTATMSSPHFDEAQRAFIESLQAAAQARQARDARRTNPHPPGQPSSNVTQHLPESQAQPHESCANQGNATQDTVSADSSAVASQGQGRDLQQETQVAPESEDNSSPYTEIAELRQPNPVGDTASSCTTDTDSDTNAEAELEQRDLDIIRAATNIRRIRLAGGMQNLVDRVTEQQRGDASQRNGEGETRRRSSSGLQNIMERINRGRENQTRGDGEPETTSEANASTSQEVANQENDEPLEGSLEENEGREYSEDAVFSSPSPSEVTEPVSSSGGDSQQVLGSNEEQAAEEAAMIHTSEEQATRARASSEDDAPLNLSDSDSIEYSGSGLFEDDDAALLS
ncbi:low-density lipoprotein receptor-related protein 12-like [Diadema setosum]|uniref:low-density lipoprotein receptor-related protein 12-like n=1 Tax=Diadema setosum TaxID=31175 RepID=UPI003B3A9E7E